MRLITTIAADKWVLRNRSYELDLMYLGTWRSGSCGIKRATITETTDLVVV
jgi:hypothetical protein